MDIGDGSAHAFARVTSWIAVAQLVSFMSAGAGAGRNDSPAARATVTRNFHLDRGIPPAIKDFASVDACDGF